jgi:hypothetical protein
MDADRFSQGRKKVIDEHWQPGDMIEMRMTKDNITDLGTLPVRAGKSKASGVDRNAIVDDDRQ